MFNYLKKRNAHVIISPRRVHLKQYYLYFSLTGENQKVKSHALHALQNNDIVY